MSLLYIVFFLQVARHIDWEAIHMKSSQKKSQCLYIVFHNHAIRAQTKKKSTYIYTDAVFKTMCILQSFKVQATCLLKSLKA